MDQTATGVVPLLLLSGFILEFLQIARHRLHVVAGVPSGHVVIVPHGQRERCEDDGDGDPRGDGVIKGGNCDEETTEESADVAYEQDRQYIHHVAELGCEVDA